MTKRIVDTGPKLRVIRDTGPKLPRVDPAQVAEALGAEPAGVAVGGPYGPVTLLAIRQEIFRRLQKHGAIAAPSDKDYSSLIKLNEKMWSKLRKLAADVATPDFEPTAGEMVSVVLSLSLQTTEDAPRKKRTKA